MRVEFVVEGADIDVVDVEQDLAVGALRELGDELPFGELGGGVGDVARHVLQHQPAAEMVLHRASRARRRGPAPPRCRAAAAGRACCWPRRPVKQRWSETHSGCTRSTSAFELVEIGPVERIDRADRQRHAVQRHRIVAAEAVEPVQRAAARHHVVLATAPRTSSPGRGWRRSPRSARVSAQARNRSRRHTCSGFYLLESPNVRDFVSCRAVVPVVRKDATGPSRGPQKHL